MSSTEEKANPFLDKRKESGGLSVKKSPLHGFGCFATIRLLKGSRIAEYTGERITHKEAMRRMRTSNGKCISELVADCYIDGNVNGNQTQYINHCCDPNSDALVMGGNLIIFALREIAPGEEITVDYLNSFDHDQSICQCRTPRCRQRKRKRSEKSGN
jgi:SET domain-containing protein